MNGDYFVAPLEPRARIRVTGVCITVKVILMEMYLSTGVSILHLLTIPDCSRLLPKTKEVALESVFV